MPDARSTTRPTKLSCRVIGPTGSARCRAVIGTVSLVRVTGQLHPPPTRATERNPISWGTPVQISQSNDFSSSTRVHEINHKRRRRIHRTSFGKHQNVVRAISRSMPRRQKAPYPSAMAPSREKRCLAPSALAPRVPGSMRPTPQWKEARSGAHFAQHWIYLVPRCRSVRGSTTCALVD